MQEFRKVLVKYYIKWFFDCHESATYCNSKGDTFLAGYYLDKASEYLSLIMENWDAIEFFSKGENAFMIDRALPVEFRGY